MANYYAQAIEVLSNNINDANKILFEIAKRNPKALVDAASRIYGDSDKHNDLSWKEECRSLMQSGERVKAVKICRFATGMSLKEALDAVDAL